MGQELQIQIPKVKRNMGTTMGTMEDFMLPPHVASEENIGAESDVYVCHISKKTPNPNPNPESGNNPQPKKGEHIDTEIKNKKKRRKCLVSVEKKICINDR